MKVKDLKEKYTQIQNESNDIYKNIIPLFKRLKKLSTKAIKLANKIDNDKELYDLVNNSYIEKGWDFSIYFRLSDFSFTLDNIRDIDTVLYNIKHTKFTKKKHK